MKKSLIKPGILLGMVCVLSGCGAQSGGGIFLQPTEPVEIVAEPLPEEDKEEKSTELLELLRQNLSTEELVSEGIALLLRQEWKLNMFPDAERVKRYVSDSGYSSLYVQTERTPERVFRTVLWYVEEERVLVIMCTDEMLQVMKSGFVNGQYEGDYESWKILSNPGSVYHMTGIFLDGDYTEEYRVEAKEGLMSADMYSLWLGKDMLDLEGCEAEVDAGGEWLLSQPIFPGMDAFCENPATDLEFIGRQTMESAQPGEVPTESEAPKPTEGQKPVQTQKPAETRKPTETTPPQTPKPTEDPGVVSTPEPTRQPQAPETSTGQETEIEWIPDIM